MSGGLMGQVGGALTQREDAVPEENMRDVRGETE